MATTTTKKFKWTAETRATVTAAYLATVKENHEKANSEAYLATLAAEVGAISARSVRSMLATEKVYEPLDAPKATSTSNRISKGQIVRSIAKGLDLDLDTVQTLDKANAEALNALVEAINVTRDAANLPAIEIK